MPRTELKIPVRELSVSAILDSAAKPIAAMTLAHGAGAGMTHAFLEKLAEELAARGVSVLRFQFPYMERKDKLPDSPDTATATIAAAFAALGDRAPGLPRFAGGKSFGARMSTTAAARGLLSDLRGIVCYGFPLHPAGEPGTERAKHLSEIRVPLTLLQGTRDALAEWDLIAAVAAKLPTTRLVKIEGADHSFGVLKRSGRTADEVLAQLADETLAACRPV